MMQYHVEVGNPNQHAEILNERVATFQYVHHYMHSIYSVHGNSLGKSV